MLECDPLLRGKRCWGAATNDEPSQKRQASPLQVKELERLHEVLEKDPDTWNRMFCGTTLFMVYSRSRWSDAQHGSRIHFDRDDGKVHYVEVLTGLHETMRALQHRHQYLPLVGPAIEDMLSEIRQMEVHPDTTRSGRLTKGTGHVRCDLVWT